MKPHNAFTYLLVTEPYNFRDIGEVLSYLFSSPKCSFSWDNNGELSLSNSTLDSFDLEKLEQTSFDNLKKLSKDFDYIDKDFKKFLKQKISLANENASKPLHYFIHSFSLLKGFNFNYTNINSIPNNISEEWLVLIQKYILIIEHKIIFNIDIINDDEAGQKLTFLANIKNRINDIKAWNSNNLKSTDTFKVSLLIKELKNIK